MCIVYWKSTTITEDLWFLIVTDCHWLWLNRIDCPSISLTDWLINWSIVNDYHFSYVWEVKKKMFNRRNTVKCNYMTVALVNKNFLFWAMNLSLTSTVKQCTWYPLTTTWLMVKNKLTYMHGYKQSETCIDQKLIKSNQLESKLVLVNDNWCWSMPIKSNLRTQASHSWLVINC